MKKLLIFDVFNYIFRAYYASPVMTTKAGFPTNALHFFVTMILSMVKRINPDGIALAFEPKEGRASLFRSKMYPDYKAQREAPPDALVQQLPYFRPLAEALGLKCYDAAGYEADDVIATLATKAHAQGYQVIIASSDKDLMQLVREDESISMIVEASGRSKLPKWISYADVVDRFGVTPDKVADVLSLSGDTVDNIPGCKGIGEKTGGKLIAEFGSLENLMANLDKIKKPAQHANLVEFSARAELTKKLVSLAFDVPVEVEMRLMEPQKESLNALLTKFELFKLRSELLGEPKPSIEQQAAEIAAAIVAASEDPLCAPKTKSKAPIPPEMPDAILHETLTPPGLLRPIPACEWLKTADDVRAFFQLAEKEGAVSVWPVWSESKRFKLVGGAFAVSGRTVYISFGSGCVQRSLFATNDDQNLDTIVLKALFDGHFTRIVYGLKAMVKFALERNFAFNIAQWFDVEMAAYDVHPEHAPYTFAETVKKYLNEELAFDPDTWLGSGKKRIAIDDKSSDELCRATAVWAAFVHQLHTRLSAELEVHALKTVFDTVDMPLIPVLAKMEYEGVKLDLDALKTLSADFSERIQALESKAYEYAGASFNINSPKQVGELLYGKLGLVPARKKKTASGSYSTDEETLESLCDEHPLPRVILDYRALSKLKSTYADALAEQADGLTGRLHGKFNACVTATTRLSSSDPNLQNIPSRDEEGRKIKRAFVAQDGWSFVGADYSQIELRLMAAFSEEPALCDAFLNGIDVHSRTAAAIFDTDVTQVTKAQRQVGKTINFALLYGMGAQKLARETGYSTKEAKVFLDKFKQQFPVLSDWFEKQVERAKETGETRTVFGHRRVMHEFYSKHPVEVAAGDRIALNAPVQGGASDIVKKAMIRFDEAVRANGLHAKLLIQVHDELLVECPDNEVERVSAVLRESMEGAVQLCVPLAVELGIGKCWSDIK